MRESRGPDFRNHSLVRIQHKCWAPATGTVYGHQTLTNIGVVVPGKDVQDVSVDFCLEDLAEAP
ncbi:MAG: hypothetical protein IPN71_22880 [Fibrobacteres bacterium]|nr:hypothetical protein [Fibrobacterota bacterium]